MILTSKHTDFSALYEGGYRYEFYGVSKICFSILRIDFTSCFRRITNPAERVEGFNMIADYDELEMDDATQNFIIRAQHNPRRF